MSALDAPQHAQPAPRFPAGPRDRPTRQRPSAPPAHLLELLREPHLRHGARPRAELELRRRARATLLPFPPPSPRKPLRARPPSRPPSLSPGRPRRGGRALWPQPLVSASSRRAHAARVGPASAHSRAQIPKQREGVSRAPAERATQRAQRRRSPPPAHPRVGVGVWGRVLGGGMRARARAPRGGPRV